MPIPTFPPVPAADRADPIPTPDDAATVTRWVGQLSDDATADVALTRLEDLPYTDLPLIEAAAGQAGLPPAAGDRLRRVLPRIRARDKASRRRVHRLDAIADFYERQALSDYAAGGHTSPKWDVAATTFLHWANARYSIHRPAAEEAAVAEAQRDGKLAIDAGCDDPTVLACDGLVSDDAGASAGDVAALFARAERQRGAGPLFRMMIDGRVLRPVAHYDQRTRVRRWREIGPRLDDMEANFKPLAASKGVPPAVLTSAASNIIARLVDADAHWVGNIPQLADPLEQALPDDPVALAIKGRIYTELAWESRGRGWASDVTAQGWKDFHARLAVAEAALTRSYALNPDDPAAAITMMTVARGQEAGHAAVQTWFERAIAADPDNMEAARGRLTDLEPKWGGSPADMVRFGHQCLAGGNWGTDYPDVLVDVHYRLATQYAADADAYWQSPGVWDDVRAVWTGYLKRYPDRADYLNSQLARYGVLCHQWSAADDAFKAAGEHLDVSLFDSPDAAAAARRSAADHAAAERT